MDNQRVKNLLNSNIQSLSQKENPSLNLIELFEITEHVAREIMGDTTAIHSHVSKFEPIERENSWITPQEFANKYKFVHWSVLYQMRKYVDDFSKTWELRRGLKRKIWFMNEKLALKYFIDKHLQDDTKNPSVMLCVGRNLEFLKKELEKL